MSEENPEVEKEEEEESPENALRRIVREELDEHHKRITPKKEPENKPKPKPEPEPELEHERDNTGTRQSQPDRPKSDNPGSDKSAKRTLRDIWFGNKSSA